MPQRRFPGMVIACRLLGVLQVEQTQDSKTLRTTASFFVLRKTRRLLVCKRQATFQSAHAGTWNISS
jgi:hypothetical protein